MAGKAKRVRWELTMIEIERFDISKVPDHARPRIVEFRGREGRLAIHCERETGALYAFAEGPRGGDRGMVVFAPPALDPNGRGYRGQLRQQADLLAGYRGGALRAGTNGTLLIEHVEDGCATVRIEPRHGRGGWTMRLDRAAYLELKHALRSWAEAIRRTSVGASGA